MCFDQSHWHFRPYLKHHTPASHRSRTRSEIEALTRNADSRYYPESNPAAIEEQVVRGGLYVRCRKPNTIYKVHEFGDEIGASNGTSSRWVKVECTNGEYHGRPISADEYRKHMSQRIPCCDQPDANA